MSPALDVRTLRTVAGARLLRRRGFTDESIAATARALRQLRVPGKVLPDATSMGLLPDRSRANYDGNIVITTPGTVVEDLNLNGYIEARTADWTVRNVWARGGTPPSGYRDEKGLIHCTHSAAKNGLVEDVLLEPSTPSYKWNGLTGHDVTIRRAITRKTTDGFGFFNTAAPGGPLNVVAEDFWIDGLVKWADDEGIHVDGNHCDGIQFQGGDGAVVRGGRIDHYFWPGIGQPESAGQSRVSPIQLNRVTAAGDLTGLVIEDNWLNGGDVGVNGGDDRLKGLNLGRIWRNRFDRTQTVAGHAIDLDADVTFDAGEGTPNQNVWADDGSPVTVRRNQ